MTTIESISLPRVRLVGAFNHPELGAAMELLRASAQVISGPNDLAELIVVAQSRADEISGQMIQALRRDSPRAGMIALLGTWCEGEMRTGRPWPGVERLYWYEFPAWWRRQLALRAGGCGPSWARGDDGLQESTNRHRTAGLIVLSTPVRGTATAFSEVLRPAGYATVWRQPSWPPAVVRGAAAGIWDGGQLSEREADGLASFCREFARDAAPIIALLDFPRGDRCELARKLGAAAILGKPWLNAELLVTIEELIIQGARGGEPTMTRAA